MIDDADDIRALQLLRWADREDLSMRPVVGGGWVIETDFPGIDDRQEVRLAWLDRGSLVEALELAAAHEAAPNPPLRPVPDAVTVGDPPEVIRPSMIGSGMYRRLLDRAVERIEWTVTAVDGVTTRLEGKLTEDVMIQARRHMFTYFLNELRAVFVREGLAADVPSINNGHCWTALRSQCRPAVAGWRGAGAGRWRLRQLHVVPQVLAVRRAVLRCGSGGRRERLARPARVRPSLPHGMGCGPAATVRPRAASGAHPAACIRPAGPRQPRRAGTGPHGPADRPALVWDDEVRAGRVTVRDCSACPRCGARSYIVHGMGGYQCQRCKHTFTEPS